ncbi:MAG TPA: ABC transporter substrate-binding protein [Candidatus Limnocylindrales bacterium]
MRTKQLRVAGVLVATFAIVLSACSSSATTAPSAPSASGSAAAATCPSGSTQIEVQSWWTTGGESTGLQKLFDAFNAANPGLCAYNAAIAGGAGTAAQAVIKSRTLAGNPPDTFQVHMGHELLDTYVNLSGGSVLAPLDSSVIDPSKFPAGVVSIISGKDGKIYTVPMNIHRANVLWYNKKVFSDNNLTPPTTWDEFNTTAATLKAKGITPLAVGDNGIWAYGMVFETILISELGADGFNGLWTGATKWDDPKVTAALNELKTVTGFINADHNSLSWDQANQLVIDGKAAMTIMGDWANGDYVAKNFTGYGWAAAPGNDKIYQALADSFPLPAKAPHPDAVKKLLAFMASQQGQDIFNPYKGSIPARIDAGNPPAGQQQYNDYQKSAMAEWKTDTVVPSMEHGAAAAPAWKSAIEAALTTFETGLDVAATQTALAAAAKDAGF